MGWVCILGGLAMLCDLLFWIKVQKGLGKAMVRIKDVWLWLWT